MAAWKRSQRGAAAAGRLPRLPRIAWVAVGWLAAAVYGFLFLRLPIAEGLQLDGVAISRAGFVLGSLLYPEGLADAWFDSGRLPAGILDRLPIAVGTLLWLGLAIGIGLPLVSRMLSSRSLTSDRSWATELERFAWAALAGLAMLSTVSLLVGLAGGLRSRLPLVLAIGGLAALVYGCAWRRRRRETLPGTAAGHASEPEWLAAPQERGLFERACVSVTIGLACWSAAVTMLGAWVPASEFDVVEYHLQAPKEFYELGRIRFLPHNVYSNMPLGTEMHTLAMMTLIGQSDPWLAGLVGKSITAALSLIGAAVLGGYLGRRYGAVCGWWGAGLWLATPGIAHVAMLGLIDGALAAYVLAAALCVTHAWEALRAEPDAASAESALQPQCARAVGWWGLAGIMAGAAAAAKYPGLIFAVAPVCAAFFASVWLRWLPGAGAGKQLRLSLSRCEQRGATVLLGLGLLVTCVPWYAKSWIQAGNPVYPLAASLFGGKTLTAAKVEQWQRAHRVPESTPLDASVAERFVGGARDATKDVARLVLTSPYVQPAMVFGLCVAICLLRSRRIETGGSLGLWLGWSLWIVGVWWLATHRIDRFWLPLSGLWAGLAAIGLCWLRTRAAPWLAYAVVIVGLGYGALMNSSSLISDNRFFVSLAALRTDVTTDEQVGRLPAEQAWLNAHLSASASRVLLIGEARVFEYRMPVLYSTCFDVNPGEALLKGRPPAEQTAGLHEHGVTHIMINWREIARYRSPGNYGFSDWPQPADIEQMIASGVVSRVDWPIDPRSAELLKVE